MKIKKIVILLIILLTFIIFTGCLEKTNKNDGNPNGSENISPIGVINAPKQEYFGEEIIFDASDSYDTNGNIILFSWEFGDGETAEGMSVKHIYKFENDFITEYPIIYPVTLFVKDNNGAITATFFQIKLYPKEYIFYLSSQGLFIKKPIYGEDYIRGTGQLNINSPQTIFYGLDEVIFVPECNWNVTIHLEKPIFIIANKIKIELFDGNGNVIGQKEEKISNNYLWKEKSIDVDGSFNKKEEFQTLKISVYGLSIRDKISILYGESKASQIHFNFLNN